MLRIIAVSAALAIIAPAAGSAAKPVPARCTAAAFRPFAAEVWSARWQRGAPAPSTIRAKRARIQCAPAGHRAAMRRIWDRRRSRYYDKRAAALWRARVTPFPGGGRWWAIPYYIVACESGARVNDPAAPNGAYALLTEPLQGVPTWETWRPDWARKWAAPYLAPKRAQDIAAHRLWTAYGAGPWECA